MGEKGGDPGASPSLPGPAAGVAPGSVAAWRLAIRPPTLVAGVAPVLLGASLALFDGTLDVPLSALALVVAVGVQIGTNLVNDWADWRKGADTEHRVGPVRVTQAGLLSPDTVRNGAIAAMSIAAVAGIVIVVLAEHGWVWLAVGSVSILSGILYTAGPFPLAYVGLGDLWAFVFFGLVATAATYGIQAGEITAASLWLGASMGCFAAALLAVNNLRDLDTDRPAGKRTLAVRIGRPATKVLAQVELAAGVLIPVILALTGVIGRGALLALVSIVALREAVRVVRADTGEAPRALIPALVGISRGQLVLAVAVAVGMHWWR